MPFWSKKAKEAKPDSALLAEMEQDRLSVARPRRTSGSDFDNRFHERNQTIRRLSKELDDQASNMSSLDAEGLDEVEAKINQIIELAQGHEQELQQELRGNPRLIEVFPFLPTAFKSQTDDAEFFLQMVRSNRRARELTGR